MEGSLTRCILVLCVAFFASLVASAPIDLKGILAQLKQDGACVSEVLHGQLRFAQLISDV
jgi:hypothetical protein